MTTPYLAPLAFLPLALAALVGALTGALGLEHGLAVFLVHLLVVGTTAENQPLLLS
jgi:hypothetical protein